MAVDDQNTVSLLHFDDLVNTTLSSAIDASQTSIGVASAIGLPTNFWLYIDSEYFKCTSQSGTTLTVSRGQNGSTAASHSSGATVCAFGLTDESGKIWTPYGGARLSTAQSKFGNSSLYLNGSSSYVSTPSHTDFAIGTGDFTLDFHTYLITNGNAKYWVSSTTTDNFLFFDYSPANETRSYIDGISKYFTGSISTLTMHHIAFVRASGVLKLYVDGQTRGSSLTCTESISQNGLYLGCQAGVSDFLNGYIDELRLSLTARWTADFTPPTSPYAALAAANQSSTGGQ